MCTADEVHNDRNRGSGGAIAGSLDDSDSNGAIDDIKLSINRSRQPFTEPGSSPRIPAAAVFATAIRRKQAVESSAPESIPIILHHLLVH